MKTLPISDIRYPTTEDYGAIPFQAVTLHFPSPVSLPPVVDAIHVRSENSDSQLNTAMSGIAFRDVFCCCATKIGTMPTLRWLGGGWEVQSVTLSNHPDIIKIQH